MITRLSPEAAMDAVPALADVLMDCIEGGATVSFMATIRREEAEGFWRRVAHAVEFGATALFVASDDGRIVGTVQLLLAMPPNQLHRAEIGKLLVHRSARGRGMARSLVQAAETEARHAGKSLVTLDAPSGSEAEKLYGTLGYVRVGSIPGYALLPDGRPSDTVIFYKTL